jgi:hypothetical protein
VPVNVTRERGAISDVDERPLTFVIEPNLNQTVKDQDCERRQ